MKKKLLAVFLTLLLLMVSKAQAVDECADKGPADKVACYEAKIAESQGQQKTLASTITYLNNKIALTLSEIEQSEAEIKALEEEIATLSVKIDRLDVSLTDVSKLLVHRIGAIYKRGYIKPFYLFFSSGGFSDFFEKNKYLNAAQQNDRKLLLEMQESKDTFEAQKNLKKTKQEELQALQTELSQQKAALGGQKAAKADLLKQTQNDEQVFQRLLETARAEYYAIQAIIAGKGEETEAGHVNAGDRIASIIQGASCNSSGTHLHFMISKNGITENPFSYLGAIDHVNCSGGGECSAGDPFNPSGGWSWPINPRVRFSQGYGVSWAVQNIPWIWYEFHNGIDINSESNSTVKAVRSGTLYQGAYLGSCTLRYVRVDHDDSDIETLYLHINY